jgi:hypothetical protein
LSRTGRDIADVPVAGREGIGFGKKADLSAVALSDYPIRLGRDVWSWAMGGLVMADLRHRAEAHGGRLEVTWRYGGPTVVALEIPTVD